MLRPVYDAHRRRRRPGVDRGRPAARPRHRRRPIASAKALWATVDRPNVFIKIPATRRGPARDHRGARRGHQRQRHADLLPRALPRGPRRLPRRARAGRGERARPLADRARSRRSSSRASTPRSTRGSTRSARPRPPALRGTAAIANARLAYGRLRGGRRDRALAGARRRRRPPAAPAVGVDRRQGPGLPRHAVRRRARRRRTSSTRCPRRRSRRSPTTAATAATPSPGTQDEAAGGHRPACAALGIDIDDVTAAARGRGRREVRRRAGSELLATVDRRPRAALPSRSLRATPGEPRARSPSGDQPAARPARPAPAADRRARAAS